MGSSMMQKMTRMMMMKYFELLCVNYFALNYGRSIRCCNIFFGRGGREGKIERTDGPRFGG
jgi:hypothetical protein